MKKINIKLAAPENYSKRKFSEEYSPQPFRSEFQRDRDRVLYSKEFRRLSGKTQVFLAQSHDHVRTRLTHTLEVAQIARVIANNLNLEPVLCEAISLGHDVGHTPFGHVGERTLSLIMNNCDHLADFQEKMCDQHKGFKHNLQSLRVTCDLEQSYGKAGLNLSNYTLWGIKHHSSATWKKCAHKDLTTCKCHLSRNPDKCVNGGEFKLDFYNHYNSWLNAKNSRKEAWSFEAKVVEISDEIAQRHHDLEDGIFVGLISHDELVEKIRSNFQIFFDKEDRQIFDDLNNSKGNRSAFMPFVSKFIVGFLSKNLINHSCEKMSVFIENNSIKSRKDFIKNYLDIHTNSTKNVIGYSKELIEADAEFSEFLRNRILNSLAVQRMDGKGNFIIRRIFKAYLSNPRQLHDSTVYFVFKQFDKTTPSWSSITKEDIGEMRNNIDSPKHKSNPEFQIALLRAICDHIAGMTDIFALAEYKKLYG